MENLSKDVLFNIATMLDLDNLLSFCNSDPRINNLVCKDKNIWNFKLTKEFPNYKEYIDQRGREAYELLVSLSKLRESIKYQGTIYELYKETKLSLNNNQIKILPPEIGSLTNLQTLSLNNNQIKSLPSEVGNLIQLRNLWIDNNRMETLPPEIGNLRNLRELWLDRNKITSLPPEIGKLGELRTVYLSNNQITSLPPEIGNLTNLRELSLYNNPITSLPPEIGKLNKLQSIKTNKNVIIPPGLKIPIIYI